MRKEDWLVGSGLNTRMNLEIGNFLQIQLRLPERSGRTIRVTSSVARKNSGRKERSRYHFRNVS